MEEMRKEQEGRMRGSRKKRRDRWERRGQRRRGKSKKSENKAYPLPDQLIAGTFGILDGVFGSVIDFILDWG